MACVSVGCDGEVVLVGFAWFAVGDIYTGGHEDFVDIESVSAGLWRDHFVGEHELCGFVCFIWGVDEFDESCFASASGEDLGFDDGEGRVLVCGD